MRLKFAIIALALTLGGCTEYWTRPNTDIRTTAADLEACRLEGAHAGVAFSAQQIETPCMVAKGYQLSAVPPTR